MEIISFSKFNQFEKDKKYHFRAFADKSLDLRQKYADLMIEQVVDDKAKPIGFAQQINAGYLINRNNEFTIIPAKEINGTQFFRVEEDLVIANIILQQRMKNKSKDKYVDNNRYKMGFKEVAFVPTNPQTHKHSKPLYYAKVTEIRNVENKTDKDLIGTLVHSGWMRGQREGKHLHWIVGPIDRNQSLTIPDLVIQNYKDDINRNEQANLLAYFKENRNVKVPCFYIESNGIIESFGHTGLFRLAYKYSLGDFIPKKNRDFDELDITTAIFGDTDHFSSRLFFEDSFLQEENFVGEKHPQILAGPKATSFQHYLVQTSFEKSFNYRNEYNGLTGLKDYNDANNTVLRGNKMYWHKEPEIWSNEADVNAKPKQYTKINPAASGTIFKGKIRFENLTDIELGALLFALDLPVGCAHKIGMGKPLGLGSIRITPKLFISNREERYKNLFSEWNENNESDSNKVNELKRKFEEYILENIDEKKDSLWDIDRLKELKAMLAFENKPKVSKTKYMALDEFRQRKVLPLPSEVIKQS